MSGHKIWKTSGQTASRIARNRGPCAEPGCIETVVPPFCAPARAVYPPCRATGETTRPIPCDGKATCAHRILSRASTVSAV